MTDRSKQNMPKGASRLDSADIILFNPKISQRTLEAADNAMYLKTKAQTDMPNAIKQMPTSKIALAVLIISLHILALLLPAGNSCK